MPLLPFYRIKRMLTFVVVILGSFISFINAQTGQVTSTPILRIEAGVHTGLVSALSVDAANRFVVTSSSDETVRVWELATSRLVSILRLPIKIGAGGSLDALSISPDGRLIVVAHNIIYEGDKGYNLFIFDRESGQILRRINDIPHPMMKTAWSPDGKWLAMGLNGNPGLRVYETTGFTVVGEDQGEISGIGLSVDFDLMGRLVAAIDGGARLYTRTSSGGIKAIASWRPERGSACRSAVFSPDGAAVAVGIVKSSKVAVLSGRDLSFLFYPDTEDLSKIPDLDGPYALSLVAWSSDGMTLSAGSYSSKEKTGGLGKWIIRQWGERGRGRWSEVTIDGPLTFYLLSLKNGGLIYNGAGITFGKIDPFGTPASVAGLTFIWHSLIPASFRLSYDGTAVQFPYDQSAKSSGRFYLKDRRLIDQWPFSSLESLSPSNNYGFVIGANSSDSSNIRDLSYNGRNIDLQGDAFSSATVSHDKSRILVGGAGNWYKLRLFDSALRQLWVVAAPSGPSGVNLSRDGRFAVVAYGDGTIRWHRASDGKELLALFVHPDRKRWVMWTPKGYFDCSPGAEGLIGWHVNNGSERAADFYPASRFFEQYYRPDVVSEVIRDAQSDEEVVARLGVRPTLNIAAGIKRPPRVSFISPRSEAQFDREEVEITISAKDLGGGVDEIRLFHNGKRISGVGRGQGVTSASGKSLQRTFTVQLVEGENRFKAVAFSQERVESEPAELKLKLQSLGQKVDMHLLVIGINRYRNSDLNLNYAEADALGIAAFFKATQARRLYRQVYLNRLLNEEATLAGIRIAFNEIIKRAKPQDTVVIYLAGHGGMVENEWYFVPHELTTPEIDVDLKKGGLSRVMLEGVVDRLPARKVFLMLDACKSGGAVILKSGYEERRALAQLARSTGIYVVSATTEKQLAAEMSQLGHGVFTYVLLEGLKGKAGGPKITVEGLIQYVKDKLPDVTEKYRGAPQYPISWTLQGMDFPLVLWEDRK